jgi:SAM-dependent methyltransferase
MVGREEHRASVARSIRLFRLFRLEQSHPEIFYSALAEDSVRQLRSETALDGRCVLDVGGGPGYFAKAFAASGARYVGVEIDAAGDAPAGTASVRGSGTALPFRSGSCDIVYSSNVVEHVRDTDVLLRELVRVCRPGGVIFLSYTLWWSPWGGHETSPWHYLGGRYARRRYRRRTGREPKNRFGESLFAVRLTTVRRLVAERDDVELVRLFPRYHPRWLWWIVRVPILGEVLSWNAAFVLRRR